jgi:hypothetical protein
MHVHWETMKLKHSRVTYLYKTIIGEELCGWCVHERWWFSACTTCNKGTNTNPYVPGFKCPDKDTQWRGRDAKVLQHS